MSLTTRIGGLEFVGGPAAGNGFKIVKFKGWNDGVDVRRESVPVPNGHGDFDLPGRRASRTITQSGYCRTDTLRRQNWHRSSLMGLLADGSSAPIVVTELGETLWASVRLADAPAFTRFGSFTYAEYEISFWAADSRKYGDPVAFGPSPAGLPVVDAEGRAPHHRGNFPATPVFVVSGSMPSGYGVTSLDRSFRVATPVAVGAPHTVDLFTGRVSIGGVVKDTIDGDVWTLPPGPPTPHALDAMGGTGTLAVHVTPTFV